MAEPTPEKSVAAREAMPETSTDTKPKNEEPVRSAWSFWDASTSFLNQAKDHLGLQRSPETETPIANVENVEAAGTGQSPQEQQQQDDASWGVWGASLLQHAKDKTMSTFELVKKDLTEFSDVVQTEATQLISTTATTIRERAPRLVDNLVGTVNTVLQVEDTTKGEERDEIPITAEFVNRSQARLFAIQADKDTYCSEPDGAPELFDDWLDHNFCLEEKKDEITQLLVNNPTIRNSYAQLVPEHVSNTTFWQRYFYKMHQFQLDEARRVALMKRGEAAAKHATLDSPKISWGDESENDDNREHEFEKIERVVVEQSETEKQHEPVGTTNERGEIPNDAAAHCESAESKLCLEDKQQRPVTEMDISSLSSFSTPKTDADSDKKDEDWMEWEPSDCEENN